MEAGSETARAGQEESAISRPETESKALHNQGTTQELRREFRWFEGLSLLVNAALAIIAVIALCIYNGQLNVMRGQLAQMIRSSAQTDKLILEAQRQNTFLRQQLVGTQAARVSVDIAPGTAGLQIFFDNRGGGSMAKRDSNSWLNG